MPFRYVNFYLTDSKTFDDGIVRWISKKMNVPNLNGSHLIYCSSKNIRPDTSITAPIGYRQEGLHDYYVSEGTSLINESNWYRVDFLSFDVTLTGVKLRMVDDQYFPNIYFNASKDGIHWEMIRHFTFEKPPSEFIQVFDFENQFSARSIQIYTNDFRFDEVSTLSISRIDFYGTLRWFYETIQRNHHFYPSILI